MKKIKTPWIKHWFERYSIVGDLVFEGLGSEPFVPKGSFIGSFFHEFFKRENILFSDFLNGYFFHLAAEFCPCAVQKGFGFFRRKPFFSYFKWIFTEVHHSSVCTENRILNFFLAFFGDYVWLMDPFGFGHSESILGTVLKFGLGDHHLCQLILIIEVLLIFLMWNILSQNRQAYMVIMIGGFGLIMIFIRMSKLLKGPLLSFEIFFEFEGRLWFGVELSQRGEGEFFSKWFLQTSGQEQLIIKVGELTSQ